MVKVLSFSFGKRFEPFSMLLVEGPLRLDFLDIYLTTFFGFPKFKNTSAMRIIFFLKMFKIKSKFRKWKKVSEFIFRYWHNCIWKCSYKFLLIRREYLLPALNGFTNSPEISNITQRDFFKLNCFHKDQ